MSRKTIFAISALALACVGAALCTGCTSGSVITETPSAYDLPAVDPDDGVERTTHVTLYYRLANENFLLGVDSDVTVLANERTETAVIRALLEDGLPPASNLVSACPMGTAVEDVTYENGILYVTLSRQFLNTDAVDKLARESYASDEEYAAAVQSAESDMYAARRMGALSIINTITNHSAGVAVQIMIDTDGTGSGRRLSYNSLGMTEYGSGLMEPLRFDSSVLVTPERMAASFFEHMIAEEYEEAYILLTGGDAVKPSYAEFVSNTQVRGRVVSYSISGSEEGENGVAITTTVSIMDAGSSSYTINSVVRLNEEDGIYKVNYDSLMSIFGN